MVSPKVVVVNLSTSGDRLGGAAIAAEWHSRFMAQQYEHPLELWRMWNTDGETQSEDLRIRHFRSKTKSPIYELLPRKLKTVFLDSDILSTLLKTKPDIVHLQNPLPPYAFEAIARESYKAGIKVVVSTHGFFEIMNPHMCRKKHEVFLWKAIAKPIIRSSRYIQAVLSGYPQEIELLEKMGFVEKDVSLVCNGLDPYFLTEPSVEDRKNIYSKFDLNPELPILLFVGNHVLKKGLGTILNIGTKLSKPANIVIGGRLSSPDEPVKLLKKYPPAKNVNITFTDYLTRSDLRSLYYMSSIFLFPSMAETLPLAIIEAMACHLPVIAYGVGGVPFQLENQSGVLISPGDQVSFHAATEKLLDNEEDRIRIASNAKSRQTDLFSWEIAARKTLDIYSRLLD